MNPFEVLLVEDSVGDTLLMAQVLEALPFPVRLHVAKDGVQALVLLAGKAFEPDLVILDLNLPELSGHEVLRRFHPSHIPIVVFSSSASSRDRADALALGAREYIEKPIDLDAYTSTVRGIVERWAAWKKDAASARNSA